MMVLDATKKAEQRALLEAELEAVGIRLNKEPPYVLSATYAEATAEKSSQEHLPENEESRRHEDHLPVAAQKSR